MTQELLPVESDDIPRGTASTSTEAPLSPAAPADLIGLLAVAGAGLLPVVLIDDLYWGTWAPKAALCLILLFPGLVLLARLVAAGDRTALLASAFLAAAGLSTALSDRPALSLFGAANWGTGLLFLAALAGSWALGAALSDRRRRQLAMAIIGAVVVNAVVAWTQARVGSGGRTRGLMGNPVYLGGLVAGGLYLIGNRFGRERRTWWWLLAVAVVAGAAQLSGGRAAVALAAIATLAAIRGAGALRTAALVAAVAIGVAIAPLGAESAVLASTRSTKNAVVSVGDTRFAVWRISAAAVREQPVFGWGPGRFPAATGSRYTRAAAQDGVVLKDAHNWVVEHAVTTGLLGLALLLAWLSSAAFEARGPLAGFSLIVCASSLVQPMHVALTPIAMLALGAARRRSAHPLRATTSKGTLALGRRWRTATVLAFGIGLTAAAVLIAGQVSLQQAVQGDSLHALRWATALSPPWPEVDLVAASIEADYGLRDGEPHRSRTLALTRRATRRDPADPALWDELGGLELQWGTDAAAAVAFRRALEANPWDASALFGTVRVARRQGDERVLVDTCRRLRALGLSSPECAPP